MTSFCFVGFLALLSSLLVLTLSDPAHAYLDAGSASLIVQMIADGAAGALVVLKLSWQKIAGIFRKDKPKSDGAEQS